MAVRNIDIDQPRYDQSTYWGRCQYFFSTTNPLNLFNSNSTLEESRAIVLATREKKWEELQKLSDDDIWRAKELYDSAYHPDTGELMNPIGRMSAQVPMNMAITGCMMNFYKSTPAVIFWQWVNQSFNALVNYTNRSGDAALSNEQIATSYVLATGGALVTALSLNRMTKKLNPLIGRCVPFVAVAAANCINIPMMRMQELQTGIPISSEDGTKIGDSKSAAKAAITTTTLSRIAMASPGMNCDRNSTDNSTESVYKYTELLTALLIRELQKGIPVCDAAGNRIGDSQSAAKRAISATAFSRNGMCAPGMIITPIVMNRLDQGGLFLRQPWLSTPLSVLICGICLTFATPMCCALFEQRASMSTKSLEGDLREKAEKNGLTLVYYNKGL